MRFRVAIQRRVSLLRAMPLGVVLPALAICAGGIALIYSASTDFEWVAQRLASPRTYHLRQLAFALMGVMLMLGVALVPTRWISSAWPLWSALGVLLLAAVFFGGRTINGARSWISLGPVNLQPSEICKPLLILALAGYLRFHRRVESPRTLVVCLVLVGIFFVPILLQPDFGTAMVFIPIAAAMIWVAGGNRLYLMLLGLIGAAALPAAYLSGALKPHQLKRIDVFLSSLGGGNVMDRSGDGYQIVQSMTAIGSGGWLGKGYGAGTQSQLSFLPERHTDFIFAVLGEEFGLVGIAAFLGLYFFMLIQMLGVARGTREPFARLVVVGVTAMFFAQAAINVGMTCGVLPVTGITLPLMSYGGSSLLAGFAALGLVANVAVQPARIMGKATF